jgi:hypothetical protein
MVKATSRCDLCDLYELCDLCDMTEQEPTSDESCPGSLPEIIDERSLEWLDQCVSDLCVLP